METFLFLAKRFWWRAQLPPSVRRMQWVAITGIALSVAALFVALSVTTGFEREYRNALLHFNAHLMILPEEHLSFSPDAIAQTIRAAGIENLEVTRVTPYLYREALLIHKGKIKGVVLKGIADGREGLVAGDALAKNLGLQKGDVVKLLLPIGRELSAKNIRQMKVEGTFQTGLYEFDSQFAQIDIETFRNLFHLPKTESGYEIFLKDPAMAPLAQPVLEKQFGPLVTIQNWVDLNQPLFEALSMEKWLFRILMGLMIFVASLNLIGVVLLLIFRRQRTTAILRALGLDSKKIRRLFAVHGFVLGFLGIFIGALLGEGIIFGVSRYHWIPLDPQIYFLERLPMFLAGTSIFIIVFLGLLLVWSVSWLAAQRALVVPIREGLHGPG